jgi:hypothetical protein
MTSPDEYVEWASKAEQVAENLVNLMPLPMRPLGDGPYKVVNATTGEIDIGPSDPILRTELENAAEVTVLPATVKGEFKKLLFQFHDIFRKTGDKTHTCPLFEQAIPLKDNIPVCVRPYALVCRAAREALKQRVKEFLAAGIIRPSNSPYNSPVWMVPKKGRKLAHDN